MILDESPEVVEAIQVLRDAGLLAVDKFCIGGPDRVAHHLQLTGPQRWRFEALEQLPRRGA
jgi:hypothetical protein